MKVLYLKCKQRALDLQGKVHAIKSSLGDEGKYS